MSRRMYSVRDLATVRQLREMWGDILARLKANTTAYPSLCDALAGAAGTQLIRDQHRAYGELLTRLELQPPTSTRRFWGPPDPSESALSPIAAAAIAAVVRWDSVSSKAVTP